MVIKKKCGLVLAVNLGHGGTMEWLFSGIGTLLISFVCGAAGGGFIGYRIGLSKNILRQSQKAGRYASQSQVGNMTTNEQSTDFSSGTTIEKNILFQSQVAGERATQSQSGTINHEQ